MPTTTQWTFTVTSAAAIDFCSICDDLSYKSPVATFEFDGSYYAVVHDSLNAKAICSKGLKAITDNMRVHIDIETPCHKGMVVKLSAGEASVKTILAWAKAVKGAPYKKLHRQRGKITVTSYEV